MHDEHSLARRAGTLANRPKILCRKCQTVAMRITGGGVRLAVGAFFAVGALWMLVLGVPLWLGVPLLYAGLILVQVGRGLSGRTWALWLLIPPWTLLSNWVQDRWLPSHGLGGVAVWAGGLVTAVVVVAFVLSATRDKKATRAPVT